MSQDIDLTPANPSLLERIVRGVCALYPLISGRGALSNAAPMRALVPSSDRVVWARVAGTSSAVPLNDLVGRAMFLFGDLDAKVTRSMQLVVRKGDTVLDVGANLGATVVPLSAMVGNTGKVLAFEPSPVVLRYLKTTLAHNDLPVTLHETALGAEDDTLTLRVPAGNAGAASLVSGEHYEDALDFDIPVRRLGDILTAEGATNIRFMKMDVEGFETNVLRGLFAADSAHWPEVILFEEHDPATCETIPLLQETGYRIVGIRKTLVQLGFCASGTDGFDDCRDFLAIHDRPNAPVELPAKLASHFANARG